MRRCEDFLETIIRSGYNPEQNSHRTPVLAYVKSDIPTHTQEYHIPLTYLDKHASHTSLRQYVQPLAPPFPLNHPLRHLHADNTSLLTPPSHSALLLLPLLIHALPNAQWGGGSSGGNWPSGGNNDPSSNGSTACTTWCRSNFRNWDSDCVASARGGRGPCYECGPMQPSGGGGGGGWGSGWGGRDVCREKCVSAERRQMSGGKERLIGASVPRVRRAKMGSARVLVDRVFVEISVMIWLRIRRTAVVAERR
jgi:hypothetical protein